MTIETKFNVGEKVFTMYLDKVSLITIEKIVIIYTIKGCNTDITVRYITPECERTEGKLFKTKEELLKSL